MSHVGRYLGVHMPSSVSYVTGGLQAWLDAFGATVDHSRGRPAIWKRVDSAGFWQGGQAAPIPAASQLFINEANARGYDILSQWMPFGNGSPPPLVESTWTKEQDAALLRAAADAVAVYPGKLMFHNLNDGNTDASIAFSSDLIARVGRVWSDHGREWGYTSDGGPIYDLDKWLTMERAFDNAGAWPSFIAYHAYGDSDMSPRHAKLTTDGFRALSRRKYKLYCTEMHYGFVGFGDPRSSKPYLFAAAAGEHCAQLCDAYAGAETDPCLFTLDSFFQETPWSSGLFVPEESLTGLVAHANGSPIAAPLMAGARAQRLRSYTTRYRYMNRGKAVYLTLALG